MKYKQTPEKKEYMKKYRERNKEKIRKQKKEYDKKYAEENREKISQKGKEYRKNNKEKISERRKLQYQRDKEKIKERVKKYYEKNRDKVLKNKRKYFQENKEKMNAYMTERRRNNIQVKLAHTLRRRMRDALNRNQKVGSAIKELGCTVDELKTHLENQFQEGMTWDNWKPDGWHIDHIKPLSKFDLTDPIHFKEACHYTNLQPLWWKENLEKSDKYDKMEDESK